jgi:predicted ATPase
MMVPSGVREIIGLRLSRLSPTARGLMYAAAVVGDGFSFEELATARAGGSDGLIEDATLLDALDEALRAVILREEEGGYHFSHPLIRRTVYESLSFARRQRLHLQAAEAIERVHRDALGGQLARLAAHYQLEGP